MEDQRSNTSQSGECADISHSGQSLDPGQGNSGSPSVMPEDLVLLPVCIINDMGYKQVRGVQTYLLKSKMQTMPLMIIIPVIVESWCNANYF